MQGSRVHKPPHQLELWEYAFWSVADGGDGHWYAETPAGCAALRRHGVVEHEDGTITVTPSILVTGHDGRWHGFLERGVWRTEP